MRLPRLRSALAALLAASLTAGSLLAAPLKVAYSDWPGWTAFAIAEQKGWFKDAGVEVELLWFEYGPSMEAYSAGKVDAVMVTNGDSLVTGAGGAKNVMIVALDYSNGNDMIVAKPGIESMKDLKGKKVGIEVGFVEHLLLLKALESAGLTEADVEIVPTPTGQTPQVLASGAVDAVAAWQPSSGQALKVVSGSKPIFTSKDVPGLIYDNLYVSPESLEKRRDDWKKVIKVWHKVVAFLKEEDNIDEVLEILSSRVSVTPDEYEPFLEGTYVLSGEEAKPIWEKADGLKSVYGSSKISDDFNVSQKVYEKPADYEKYLDPSLTLEVIAEMAK